MGGDELYVETRLDVDMADLRAATQEPDEHERWDLRFTDIDYRPRPDESEPQRFDYAARVGFGVGVEGHGESTGETRDGGVRTSALRFWSDDPTPSSRRGPATGSTSPRTAASASSRDTTTGSGSAPPAARSTGSCSGR